MSSASQKLRLFLPGAVQGDVEAGLLNEGVGIQVDTTAMVTVVLTVEE